MPTTNWLALNAERAVPALMAVDEAFAGHGLEAAGGVFDRQPGPARHGGGRLLDHRQEHGQLGFLLGEEAAQDAQLDAALGCGKSGRQVVQMPGQTHVDIVPFLHDEGTIASGPLRVKSRSGSIDQTVARAAEEVQTASAAAGS